MLLSIRLSTTICFPWFAYYALRPSYFSLLYTCCLLSTFLVPFAIVALDPTIMETSFARLELPRRVFAFRWIPQTRRTASIWRLMLASLVWCTIPREKIFFVGYKLLFVNFRQGTIKHCPGLGNIVICQKPCLVPLFVLSR